MFGDDLVISGIRAQTNRLQDVLSQIENDEKWEENHLFYSQKLKDIEKTLGKIRKRDFGRVTTF